MIITCPEITPRQKLYGHKTEHKVVKYSRSCAHDNNISHRSNNNISHRSTQKYLCDITPRHYLYAQSILAKDLEPILCSVHVHMCIE